jgi:CheY-like chemotaxis protein
MDTPATSFKKKILVIEDDRYIRETVTELLESEGYDVSVAINGHDALEQLRRSSKLDRLPSLIVLDLMMPVKDGFAFREEQVKDPILSQIPVIVMSADEPAIEKMKRVADIEYLKKPIELDELLGVVRKRTVELV